MTQPTATLTRQSAFVTLTMDEEVAQRVMALLTGSLTWTNNLWARDVYVAIANSGVEPPEELYDEVRHEVEHHIEGTADDPVDQDEGEGIADVITRDGAPYVLGVRDDD